ncbi:MAG: MFS transporter [Buchananella hordeovulneris]|nr:MFS transporter [Buchananella hordeovulneris]
MASIVTTFVFSVYLTSKAFGDTDVSTSQLSAGLAIAGLIIAILAPINGQQADKAGKGIWLLGFNTLVMISIIAGMFFVDPAGSYLPTWLLDGMRSLPDSIVPADASPTQVMLVLGIILLGLGNIFFEFATVNYNAMLASISNERTIGRVSGLGWGLGYLGGIVLLLIVFVGFINPEVGWFGVTSDNGQSVRVTMLFSAAWFFLFALPVMFTQSKFGKRRAAKKLLAKADLSKADVSTTTGLLRAGAAETKGKGLFSAYRAVWGTIKMLYKNSPSTLLFLGASAVFRDGLAGVFAFAGIIALGTFHFTDGEVIIFGIVANVVAGVATIVFGSLDDKLGPKRVIMISLISMIMAGLGVFFLASGGKIVYWVLGLTLSIFIGPAQSASRTYLARLIPKGREGEIFGLYATTGRAVSFLSPAIFFGAIKLAENFLGPETRTQLYGLLGLAFVLFVGLMLLIPVHAVASPKAAQNGRAANVNVFEGE